MYSQFVKKKEKKKNIYCTNTPLKLDMPAS